MRQAAAHQAIRLALVHLRERAHAVVAQEFRLIEHPAQETFHAVTAQEGKQVALAHPVFLPARDEFGEIGTVIEIPLHAAGEAGKFFQQRRIEDFDGKERNQADHRAYFQNNLSPARGAQFVVVKLVCFIPETQAVLVGVDGGGDIEKMLEELGGNVFINWIVQGQFERDAQEVEAIHGHPARAVGLIDVAAGGQRRAAVEHTDVVEAEKATLENVPPLRILAIHPPGEVQQQLVIDAFQEFEIARVARLPLAALLAVNLKHAPRRPRVDGRVYVAELPLVGGELAVRVHVPLAGELRELVLGELRVHERERNAMEREVPRGIPRIFPLVRHRHDAGIVHVRPFGVATALALRRWRRLPRVTAQPLPHVVTIILFAP